MQLIVTSLWFLSGLRLGRISSAIIGQWMKLITVYLWAVPARNRGTNKEIELHWSFVISLYRGVTGGMQFRISAIFSPISANFPAEISYFCYPQGSWINTLSAFRRNDDWFPHFRTQNSPFPHSAKPQGPPIYKLPMMLLCWWKSCLQPVQWLTVMPWKFQTWNT